MPGSPAQRVTFVPHNVLHRVQRSAGGVLWRSADGHVEIALVHRLGRPNRHWSLPKGGLLVGETGERAAVREVAEETGYRVQRGPLVGSLVRRTRSGKSKLTTYWLMSILGGRFRANREVDAIAWVDLEEAARRLRGRPEATLLEAIRESLPEELEAVG